MNTQAKSTAPVANIAQALIRLMRPEQWTKNVFVLLPILFGHKLGVTVVPPALLAFACFCLLSSAIYCINDVFDAPADRLHPRKRLRPVASGVVGPSTAIAFAILLFVLAFSLSFLLPVRFRWIACVYVANNFGYFLLFKRLVILDVLIVAIGFVLRILAGCAAVSIVASSWIIVCGFSLAMLLGFGKRRLELTADRVTPAYRHALESYDEAKLDTLMAITSSLCLMSYMLYTVSPETVARHQTDNLVYSVPIVAYGIFRFLFKVREGGHDGPDELLLKDPVFSLIVLVWLIMVAAILAWPHFG